LTAKATENLALAFHELATNAVKHGALSIETGRIRIGWQISAFDFLFVWIEERRPTVKPTERRDLTWS
jgi:two-component sensor histidine kinase